MSAVLVGALVRRLALGAGLCLAPGSDGEPPADDRLQLTRVAPIVQRAHSWLAKEADSVIEVVAGRAIEWKPDKEPKV